MKNNRSAFFLVVPLGLLALVAAGCNARESETTAALPATKESAPGPAATGLLMADRGAPAAASDEAVAPRWVELERHTYEMRVAFLEGAGRLEAVVEAQVAEVTARRAAIMSAPRTVDLQTWDADMTIKEMDEARSYLTAMVKEARAATADTWSQKKEKVGQAWARTQAAYEKAKAGTSR